MSVGGEELEIASSQQRREAFFGFSYIMRWMPVPLQKQSADKLESRKILRGDEGRRGEEDARDPPRKAFCQHANLRGRHEKMCLHPVF